MVYVINEQQIFLHGMPIYAATPKLYIMLSVKTLHVVNSLKDILRTIALQPSRVY